MGFSIGVWRSICHIVVDRLEGIILLDMAYYTDSNQIEAIPRNCSKFIMFLTFRFLRQKGITKVKDVRTQMGKGANELVQGEVHSY